MGDEDGIDEVEAVLRGSSTGFDPVGVAAEICVGDLLINSHGIR